MKIEIRNLSDIKPYPGNPRQNDAAVDAVAEEPPIAEVPLPLRRHRWPWWTIAVVFFGTLVALVALVFWQPRNSQT